MLNVVQGFVSNNPDIAADWTPELLARAFGLSTEQQQQQQQQGRLRSRQPAGTGVYLYKRALMGDEQVSSDSYKKALRPNYYV